MEKSTLPKITIAAKPKYIHVSQDIDFYRLFEKIEQAYQTCFLLESLGSDEQLSRYSIVGFSPKHVLEGNKNELIIDQKHYKVENPYYALREVMPEQTLSRMYAGGLVGYLSYEAMTFIEPTLVLKKHPHFPLFLFGVYTDGLVYDKFTSELTYFYYDTNRLKEIIKLQKTKPKTPLKVVSGGDTMIKAEHTKKVNLIKEEIIKGNTFQCQLGFQTTFNVTGDTLQIYKNLRKINPSPFMYYMKFGEKKIIGASPELLFRLTDGEMETFPLAGTIRRGKTRAQDKKLARELLHDKKERAEHNMLVDLHRNDIGRVAKFGTVKLRQFMDIKKFSHVQHISSEIAGIMSDDVDVFKALAYNFPAGTLTGAPKIESMKIINRHETAPRGPYGGALGHFGFNGNCTFAIPIRTIFLDGTYGYTQAASGIVYDSDTEKEYDEVQQKLAATKKALNI